MIALTPTAAKRIKALLVEKKEPGLRAAVQGGGCSGFTYQLKFDWQKPTDRVISSHDIEIYIDPKSYLYLIPLSVL